MTKHRNDSAHGRVHRPRRRLGRAPLLLAALLGALVAGPLLASPAPAQAQAQMATSTPSPDAPGANFTATPAPTDDTRIPSPTPAATPSPTPPAAPPAAPTPTPTVEPAVPTIDGPAPNDFVAGSITVGGSRGPDQEIQLLSPTGGDPLCIVAANGSTTWQCTGVDLPSGPSVTLRAVVTGASSLSATVSVRVLHAPSVTGGSIGQASSNGAVRGTGYPGATVTATQIGRASCRERVSRLV